MEVIGGAGQSVSQSAEVWLECILFGNRPSPAIFFPESYLGYLSIFCFFMEFMNAQKYWNFAPVCSQLISDRHINLSFHYSFSYCGENMGSEAVTLEYLSIIFCRCVVNGTLAVHKANH